MMLQQAPMFSNDLTGFIKIIGIMLATVLLPLGGLVVYFLKSTDKAQQVKLEGQMNGLGERLNKAEKDQERQQASILHLNSLISESSRDVMTMIQTSAEAQTRVVREVERAFTSALKDVEIKVARLEERNDLGNCISEFGKSIERLVERMEKRNGHA